MQSDAELVNRVLKGDQFAYDKLVQRYEATVIGISAQVLGDLHAAEDAAQESFVHAYLNLPKLRDPKVFGIWLFKITKREAIRLLKQRARHNPIPNPVDLAAPQQDEQLNERLATLLNMVIKLPPRERQVIILRNFNNHSVREIAEITGRSIGTITKQLSQARNRLRKQL